MTNLQEEILDRLVGATLGVNWPDSALTLAARVVGGDRDIVFGLTDNDRGPKAEIARRLGYPVLLCEAIQGGMRGLAEEEDRRSLAMTLFRTLPLGESVPRLSSNEQNLIALQMAIRSHPVLCPHLDCEVLVVLKHLQTVEQPVPREEARECMQAFCTTAKMRVRKLSGSWLTASASQMKRLIRCAALVLSGFRSRKSANGWCALREAVRLAASEQGVEEAVDYCMEIARLAGMNAPPGTA